MAIFKVEGGHRLHGSITPQGAKNEALQILCATLLTPRRVVVHNVPRILDVMQLIDLLRAMGVEVEQLADNTYAFCAREIDLDYLLTEDYRRRCARLRGSVMLIGPLLARFGVGYVPKPGGDKIGRRRLDTHNLGHDIHALRRRLPHHLHGHDNGPTNIAPLSREGEHDARRVQPQQRHDAAHG